MYYLIFAVVLVVALLFATRRKRHVISAENPPQPNALPVLGHLHYLMMQDIDKVALDLNRKYGDVVEINLAGEPMWVITGNELTKQVLSSSNYNLRWLNEDGLKEIDMYKKGIAFNHILPDWKLQKRFFKNGMGTKFMQAICPTAEKNAKILCKSITKQENKVNIANLLQCYTLDTVGELAFGQEFRTLSEETSEFAKSIIEFMQAWVFFILTPTFVYKYVTLMKTKYHRKVIKQISKNVQEIISTRRKQIEIEPDNPKWIQDFLGGLIVAIDEEDSEKRLSDMEVQMEVREMLLGASDTSANSLTFTMYWLARNPQVQERMVAELSEIVGDNAITMENQAKLTYFDQVINEVQRLSPGSPIVPRRSIEEDILGPFKIPAGTNVLVNLQGNNLNPNYWKNPMEFNPDRFSANEVKNNAKSGYFPFGYGGKGCPGQAVAKMVMKTALAVLVKNFKFELANPEQPLETRYCIVSQMKNNMLMVIAVPR